MKLSKYQRAVLVAFENEMKGKHYGQEEKADALSWFCSGWAACCDHEAKELRSAWSDLEVKKICSK